MTIPATGRVVIAGTGIAGATAAETLRKRGFDGDIMLLATGGRPRTLGVPIPGAVTLRDRHDATALREVLARPGIEVLVVGGGLIGTEVAASARTGGAQVTILEAGPRILDRVFPEPVSAALESVHRARGVAVHTGTEVTGADTVSGCTRLRSAEGREWIADDAFLALALTGNRLVGAVAAGRPRELRAARTLIGSGAELPRDRLAGPIDLASMAA